MGGWDLHYRGAGEKTRLDRMLQPFAASRLGGRLFLTVFPWIDKRVMPLTRGRLRVGIGQPVCLLHCTGARSGEARTVPLLYTPRGSELVLVASRAGTDQHPAWYHNVIAHPDVEVEINGIRRPMRAREVDGPERNDLWALVNDNYAGYETYQGRTRRRIPVLLFAER